jgi:protocatechuate 3,4-dioxygenase beta subunit
MRSIKPLGAVVPIATAALLALAPAVASAAGRHALRHTSVKHDEAPSGGCRLDVNVAPRFIETGETTVVPGLLRGPPRPGATNPGTSVAGQAVTIFSRSAAAPNASPIGTATTDATGNYQFTTPVLTANSQFYATAAGAKSGRKGVKVSPKISLVGPADGSQLFTGGGPLFRAHARRLGQSNKVTFSGSVSPEDAGAIVALQRESSAGGEEWHRIDTGTVGQDGKYSIVHTFAVPGDANIRTIVRARKRNAPGASESFSYEISQAENPALTITNSADPLSFGQSVTVSGTIAAPNAPVTLLERNRLQRGFAAVATVTAGADGTYAFPTQTPQQSTFYKVTGAGKTSSRLFEGVRYGLSAAASASTVQAGRPITFSGTVTPGHAGHPVYLQVQNGTGIRFHTVEVAQVTHEGTYTIEHTLYAVGSRKLRVRVPGDPENQGVASPLFGVEVTPAPAAALTPEPPSNSSQPAEGQL